jgi:RNA:NAD 2'-phosphotransferase (TPT1/KptA family)
VTKIMKVFWYVTSSNRKKCADLWRNPLLPYSRRIVSIQSDIRSSLMTLQIFPQKPLLLSRDSCVLVRTRII